MGDGVAHVSEKSGECARSLDRCGLIEIRADASSRGESAIHRADDFGDRHIGGGASEAETTAGATPRDDDAGAAQPAQDLLEERRWNRKPFADLLPLAPSRVGLGDGQKGETTVFTGRGETHLEAGSYVC